MLMLVGKDFVCSIYRPYGVIGVNQQNVNLDVCMVNLDDLEKEVLALECTRGNA